RYMASLFTAGDEDTVIAVYRKLLAGRIFKRAQTVGDISMERARQALEQAQMTSDEVEDIFHMTALAGFDEMFVIPPMLREVAIEMGVEPHEFQEERGAGFLRVPERGL
ncbi:MAG: nitrate reductase subunit beta, partial [Terriglobia bacterium]